MRKDVVFTLGRRSSVALVLGAAVAAGWSGYALAAMVEPRMSDWCRDMLVSVSGLRALPVAVAVVASARIAMALLEELRGSRTLSRRVAAQSAPMPASVSDAVLRAGLSANRVTVIADARPFAYTVGLLRPSVVVSTGLATLLTRAELRSVLAHEARHAEGLHPLRALAWAVLTRAFFFLPVLRDVAEHAALLRELDADRAAESVAGRRTLASAMLALAQQVRAAPAPALETSAASPFAHLTGRIEALQGKRTAPFTVHVRRIAASAASTVAMLAVTAVPASAMFERPAEGACAAVASRAVSALLPGDATPMSHERMPSSTWDDLRSSAISP